MSGGSILGIALGGVVIATLLALLVARSVTVRVDPEPDYADLVPAPDGIEWNGGDETTLWLSTNRHAVDVRVDSVALGLGAVRERPSSGAGAASLGTGLGCIDWVVDSLTATPQSNDQWQVTGTVERGPGTTGELTVKARVYDPLDRAASNQEFDITVIAGADDFVHTFSVVGTGERRLDASTGPEFPVAATRSVLFDAGDTAPGVTDYRAAAFRVPRNTGLDLVACGEREDVTISLHGEDGEELNRYLVDLEAAVPTPTPRRAPDFGKEYTSLRFCADAASPRGSVLSGGEAVGTVTATGDAPLAYSLAPFDFFTHYAYFTMDQATGEVTVSELGADDTTGLDGSRLYFFEARATDPNGLTGETVVAAQLSLSPISQGGDGSCP